MAQSYTNNVVIWGSGSKNGRCHIFFEMKKAKRGIASRGRGDEPELRCIHVMLEIPKSCTNTSGGNFLNIFYMTSTIPMTLHVLTDLIFVAAL